MSLVWTRWISICIAWEYCLRSSFYITIMAFYLVDKWVWPTSFGIVARLRKILWIKKVGHCGTLDPLASGLFLIATWSSTRLLEYCVGHDKVYQATILLDGMSETCDMEWPIRVFEKEEIWDIPSLSRVQEVVNSFIWEIQQIPPKHSAIKKDGKPLYQYARSGKEVVIPSRIVSIHSAKVVEYCFPRLKMEFEVGSWTYIRSLARDIWVMLTWWGYLESLRRTSIGHLTIDDAICIEKMKNDTFAPLDYKSVFPDIEWLVCLDADEMQKLQNGIQILPRITLKKSRYFIKYPDQSFGLLEWDDEGRLSVLKNNI